MKILLAIIVWHVAAKLRVLSEMLQFFFSIILLFYNFFILYILFYTFLFFFYWSVILNLCILLDKDLILLYSSPYTFHDNVIIRKTEVVKLKYFDWKKMFVLEHVEQIFTMFCKYVDQSGVCHVVKVALYKGK